MKKVLIFMGSPRFGGNTDTYVREVAKACEEHGGDVERINLYGIDIGPCIECGACDDTGKCVLKDEMAQIYDSLERADAIVVASPIFFYNISSRTQALVERSQALWVRKYVLKSVSKESDKRGVFISIGATKGKKLFDGVLMVMKYFFDAINCPFERAFLYRGIEKKGEIRGKEGVLEEARELGKRLALGTSLEDIGVDAP
ncbi:MAG TPA: flavodoxin family protein [Dissulfuribacter thermophilus]|uniref:Flavodoxin family protein n=1 Tax=Dissulfuribacter thermophilus TaxID=1156395 RepID=A0A7V2WSA4_9BACT|nr:flavodoxin family protein [Dissulfuribacter thermophilus]